MFTEQQIVIQETDVAAIYRSSVRQNKFLGVMGGEVTNDT